MLATQNNNTAKPSANKSDSRIFLIGFMGSGKTHWGRLLAQKMKLPFFDLDEEVVAQEQKTINEIFSEKGEEHFRLLEKEVLHQVAESNDTFVMATGGGAPCYYNNMGFMKNRGLVLWINSPVAALYERLVKEKDKRPLIKDLDEGQLMAYLTKKIRDRKLYYEQADIQVSEKNISLEYLVDKIAHF